MESERLRVNNSKRSMTISVDTDGSERCVDTDSDCGSEHCVDTDSDCGSESILLATDNDTNVKSKPIPAKRQKTRRDQPSTRLSIRKKYNFVKPSSHSDSHYFCTVCQKDVSIKHQGACT